MDNISVIVFAKKSKKTIIQLNLGRIIHNHKSMKEFYGGLIPHKDDRDFCAEHILGAISGTEEELPKEVRLHTKANNQGASTKTKVACTCFSTYNVATILNELENKLKIAQKPAEGWEEQKKFGTHSANGDSLNTAFKSIIKNGLINQDKEPYKITGFARITNDEVKKYLARGIPVITYGPVSKTNFVEAKKSGLYSPYDKNPTVTYHAYAIVGYYDDVYLCMNSYGPEWGVFKNGTFELKQKNIKQIGTKYILFDAEDVEKIFRDVSTKSSYAEAIRYCLDRGLIKGDDSDNIADPKERFFRPEATVTRGELAQILYRLTK